MKNQYWEEPEKKDMATRKIKKMITNLDGILKPNVKRCNCCGKVKTIEHFYQHGEGNVLSSKDKRWKIRNQCSLCYRIWFGKIPTAKDFYIPTNNLESFFV